MSSLTAYDAFEVRLRDGWSTTDLVFENEFYQLPDTPAPFVYVEIFGSTYDQDTMGAPQQNEWLETGWTKMHVMTPSGQGSRQARRYANSLLYLFREQPIGNLFMPKMSIGNDEPGKDFPGYWSMAGVIDWYRRDITSIPPAS